MPSFPIATLPAFDDLERVYVRAVQPYDGLLSAELLMSEAEQVTGVSDWGGERWSEVGFRSRFTTLCKALEEEAALTPVGRSRAHGRLHAMLCSRLRVLQYRKTWGAEEKPIIAPLVGTGMPRAGTSFLHQLLAQDPENLGTITGEAMVPVPPPGVLRNESQRMALVDNMLKFQGLDAPEVNAVHPFAPDASDEDVLIQEAACGSLYQAFFNVPSFLPVLWSSVADLYEWQKGMMQLLQSGRSVQRWVLKAPEHISYWATMWRTFPDARVFVNHRDPAKVVASIASLYTTFQSLNSKGAMDPKYLGPPMLQGQIAAMDQVTTWRAAHRDVTIVDVHYKELIADPIREAERVYSAFGLHLSARAKDRMLAFITVNRHGQSQGGAKHHYRLEDFGLTETMIEEASAQYMQHYGVAREKRE
jgi:hypothetical protein